MNWFNALSLSGSIFCFTISIYVYSRIAKSSIHKWYCLAIFSIGFWTFDSFFMNFFQAKDILFMIHKLLYLGAITSQFAFINWARLLRKDIKKWENLIVNILISWSIIIYVLNFSNNFIEGTSSGHYYFSNFIQAGILYFTFSLLVLGCSTFGTYLVFRRMKESEGQEKTQLLYIIAGTITMYVAGYVYFSYLYKLNVYPVADFFVVVSISIFAYAIVRHQLMEIEVIIKKTLIFAGLFAAAFAVFIIPTLIIQEFIVAQMGLGGRIIGLSISAILIILILRPLENFLVKSTDKFLFQKKYDYKELLKTFSTEVLTVLDKDVLVHTTVDRLSNIMKIQSSGILLLNETKNQYELVASIGVDKNWRNISLGLDNTLASFLSRTKSYLSAKHQGKDSPMPKRIVEDMNKLKLELAIPLFIHDDMIGMLTLGKKKSDEDYTQDAMDILLPLSRTLAIAISNAVALDELKKTQAEAAQREKMAVIGTLSAGINHEICNPLGIARGHCEAFLLNIKDGLYKKKSDKELLEKAQTIMAKVIHETDRATAVTKKLSNFAKPSKGSLTDDIDIREEINEVFALVGYEMKLEGIELENKIPKDLTHIMGDAKQIQEIFFNLIRNAAQAIQEKGKITIRAHEDIGKVYVEIEDTGHGIPEDKLDQVFNPFYTTKDPGKGTGLGLFIVRQVVERNNGRISVKSKVGEGATFSLEFPVAEKAKV